MSTQVIQYRVDDLSLQKNPLTEEPAEETIRFALNGTEYEIDLGPKNRAGFWKAIAPYKDAARKVGGRHPRRSTAARVNSAKAREWAREQGYDVKDHGRLPEDILAKYQAATGAKAA